MANSDVRTQVPGEEQAEGHCCFLCLIETIKSLNTRLLAEGEKSEVPEGNLGDNYVI